MNEEKILRFLNISKPAKKEFIKKIVLLALIIVLLIWIIQLLICEFMTFKYSSYIDLYKTSETLSYWIDDSFSAKITSYPNDSICIAA